MFVLLPVLLLSAPTRADEGMWLPEQLPEHAQRLHELGLRIPVAQLADPKGDPLGAIVSLGFCSASFVSPDGLIATNHHCVAGYLGANSSADANRARDGYLAKSQDDELWAGPGARLTVVESITDVTDPVLAQTRGRVSDAQRQVRIAEARKSLVAHCESDADHRCRVASYYGGTQYRLIRSRQLRDIRIAYAPPESVGSFGGDVDNWMWPRHAGDFGLLRAYVAPDGSTADHALDNVPYKPAHWLRIDPTGAQDGEMVMVAGFPGHTARYALAEQLRFARDTSYPWRIAHDNLVIKTFHALSDQDPEGAARLATPIDWVENGRKYAQGMLDDFAAAPVVQQVQAREDALRTWIAADHKRKRTYGKALAELDALQAKAEADWPADAVYGELQRYGDLLGVATGAVRLATERQKPDLQRDEGYQARDEENIRASYVRLDRTLYLPADQRVLRMALADSQALPMDQHIGPLDAFLAAHGGIDGTIDLLFSHTALSHADARLALLDQDAGTLAHSDDPWVQLAEALETWEAPRRARDKQRQGAHERLMPLYMQALLASRQGDVYPDANGSLRVTFGKVEGYSPRDGVWYLPHTTVQGMVAKAGAAPFDAPQRLLDAASHSKDSPWVDPALGDVPVDFLTTLDTTGGNSGSATINGKGELVGLIFDGNYEAMSADWLFDPDHTRSIHVDIRYLLWMLQDVDKAQWILDELGVQPQ